MSSPAPEMVLGATFCPAVIADPDGHAPGGNCGGAPVTHQFPLAAPCLVALQVRLQPLDARRAHNVLWIGSPGRAVVRLGRALLLMLLLGPLLLDGSRRVVLVMAAATPRLTSLNVAPFSGDKFPAALYHVSPDVHTKYRA